MTKKTILNKESLRRAIAADLGIKIDEDDPLLLAAHIAALVTRDTIAQERAHNADTQLLSFGDVRTVLAEARDEAILTSKQLLGIVFMQAKDEGIELVAQMANEKAPPIKRRAAGLIFLIGAAVGCGVGLAANLYFV